MRHDVPASLVEALSLGVGLISLVRSIEQPAPARLTSLTTVLAAPLSPRTISGSRTNKLLSRAGQRRRLGSRRGHTVHCLCVHVRVPKSPPSGKHMRYQGTTSKKPLYASPESRRIMSFRSGPGGAVDQPVRRTGCTSHRRKRLLPSSVSQVRFLPRTPPAKMPHPVPGTSTDREPGGSRTVDATGRGRQRRP